MVRVKKSSRPTGSSRKVVALVIIGTIGILFCIYTALDSSPKKDQGKTTMLSSIRSKGSSSSSSGSLVASAYSATKNFANANSKPFLIYGTAWKKEDTSRLVSEAIHSGFRFIDTACQPKHYNEKGVGNGWKKAAKELNLQRSDIVLQTKFTSYPGQDPNNVPYDPNSSLEEQVQTSVRVSLQNLQTDYIDSLVLHSPLRGGIEDTMKVWRAMEAFVDQGKVHKLGISNCYDYNKFLTIYEEARIKPWIIQNRFYEDSHFDTEIRKFIQSKRNSAGDEIVWYQSFWTLTANRKALATREIKDLAASKQLTPQTLMYAFLMSTGYVTPLSGTKNSKHMAEDVAVMERMRSGEKIFQNDEELRYMANILRMPDL